MLMNLSSQAEPEILKMATFDASYDHFSELFLTHGQQ